MVLRDDKRDSYLIQAAATLLDLQRPSSASALVANLKSSTFSLPSLRRIRPITRKLNADGDEHTLEKWDGFGSVSNDRPSCLTLLDEISDLNWSTEFAGTRLVRNSALEQIEGGAFDFVLIESAWTGYQDEWLYAFTSPGLQHANAKTLIGALEKLRATTNKPIVMINKEDPLHFEKFLPVMKYADCIFTTDAEMVPEYKAQTNALTVTALPFAANLKITNPIGRYREQHESVCFAGSYYSEGHEERARQMEYMLEPITSFNGVIYDRMSVHKSERYQFPARFRSFIRPSVPFREMTGLYRKFKTFLNVNTIVSSPTMMSRRVYEILASGTPVVSAPSKALEEQFSGIVPMATTAKSANDAVGRLLSDDRYWWKTSQKGIREVALKHQYKHRADLIKSVVLGKELSDDKELVSVVVSTKRLAFFDRLVESITKQTYPRMEVILALRESWPEEKFNEIFNRLSSCANIERVEILKFPDDTSLGLKLNAAISSARGEFIAKFDDDDWYFPNYLQDMVLTFDFSGADIAGKWTFPVWLESNNKLILRNVNHEHRLTDFVAGATILARTSWLRKLSFADRSQGEDTDLLKRTVEAGGKIYAADHFNFINYRASNVEHHTWKAEDALFERTGNVVGTKDDFSDWVV